MTDRRFRFGATAAFATSGKEWTAIARRAEQLGYDSLLMPDGLWTMAPFAGLAAAAAVTQTLRLGTYVVATPLHPPAQVAYNAETLDLLSDQRFELGLGAGRPDGKAEAEQLGRPFGTPRQRHEQVVDAIAAVKKRFAGRQRQVPRLLLAGASKRIFELAAAEADTLAIPVGFEQGEDALAARVAELRAIADSRIDRLELATNIFIVGDGPVPPPMRALVNEVPADSYSRLSGSPAQMADTLLRRRDQLGISYLTISQPYLAEFAPVVERLTGT